MRTVQQQARICGLWYLAMGLTAPIGLLYVPDKIFVRGNAAATAEHLRTMETLVRIGIGTELFHQAIGVFLVLALYRLFKHVDAHQARLLVVLGALLSVPIMYLNVLNQIAALAFAKGEPWLSAIEAPQRDALAYLFFTLHSRGIDVASIFWGLWLFPFGLLVIRSGFIPRVIGWLLFIAGAGYVAAAFAALIAPAWRPAVLQVTGLTNLGELPVMFWLLIWGARGPEAAQELPA